MLLRWILLSTGKIYVKRTTILRGFVTSFHDRFVFNGRGALRILSRCSASDAITLLSGHENSSFPLSYITLEKRRTKYFHNLTRSKKEGKLSGWFFLEVEHTRRTSRKNKQLREITASRKLTMLFTGFFSNRVS